MGFVLLGLFGVALLVWFFTGVRGWREEKEREESKEQAGQGMGGREGEKEKPSFRKSQLLL